MKRIITIILVTIYICSLLQTVAFAHKGRTDQYGGHKDVKNTSGLGYYHYHCGGYPPHLHKNGICPYNNYQLKNDCSKSAPSSNNIKSFSSEANLDQFKNQTENPTPQSEKKSKNTQANIIALLIFAFIVINIIIFY